MTVNSYTPYEDPIIAAAFPERNLRIGLLKLLNELSQQPTAQVARIYEPTAERLQRLNQLVERLPRNPRRITIVHYGLGGMIGLPIHACKSYLSGYATTTDYHNDKMEALSLLNSWLT